MKEADLEIKIEAELEVTPPLKGAKGKGTPEQILTVKNCGGAPIFTADFSLSVVSPDYPDGIALTLPEWILSLRPRQSAACESGRIPVTAKLDEKAVVVLSRRDTGEEVDRAKIRVVSRG